MPLYDIECKRCKHEWEEMRTIAEVDTMDGYFVCPECGFLKGKIVIKHYRNEDWFHPHWNEHFEVNPVFVKSRNHLKQLCDKYGMVSNALGDHRNIKEI